MSPQPPTPSTSRANQRAADLEKPHNTSATHSPPLSRTSSTVASHNEGATTESESVNAEFHKEAYGPEPGQPGWDPYEVRFAPNDPDDPHNWSRVKRWYITLLGGMLVLNAYVSHPPNRSH